MKQGVARQQAGKRSASFHMAIVIFTSFQIRLIEKKPHLASLVHSHSQNPHVNQKKKDDGMHSIEHVYFSCSAVRL